MSALKLVRWIAWCLVAVAIFVVSGVAVGWFRTEWLGQGPPVTVTSTGTPAIGGPFSLVNHRGERVTQDTFQGKATAYFFGFTHCPEVCPTTLFEMSQHLKDLGPDAAASTSCSSPSIRSATRPSCSRPTWKLRSAHCRAHRHARGAGGGRQGLPHRLSQGADRRRGYTMEHTASVIVTDAKGELVTLIDYHEEMPSALAKLKRAIRGSKA